MDNSGPAQEQQWTGKTEKPRQTFVSVMQHNRQNYCDGLVAVAVFFVSQLLICGLQQVTASIEDFPAPILAMMMVAAVMILASQLCPNMDNLYQKYLRRPTDLINRHMSIGFTVPFTMIIDGPMSSSRNIGLIIAGYIITGVLNTFLVLGLSLSLQSALMSVKMSHKAAAVPHATLAPLTLPPLDLSPPSIPAVRIESCRSAGRSAEDRVQSYVSATTTLANSNSPSPPSSNGEEASDTDRTAVLALGAQDLPTHHEKTGPHQQAHQTAHQAAHQASGLVLSALLHLGHRAARFAAANPIFCCCVAAIPVVGVPVAAHTSSDTALDTFVLFSLWTGTLAAQAAVKRTPSLQHYARARTVLATFLNAVLWSSLGTMAYLAAKAAARRQPISAALDAFSTGTTLADMIRPARGPAPTTLGAGDIASSILDAGIVSWGLKLFECRAQLLSRAGLTTLAVGAIMAVGNIVCGPLLVHAMGLAPPAKVLAFAARSVTLALAGPAMTNLGGDVGLNAAMVVFNGIVFQVAMGLGLYRWAGGRVATVVQRHRHHGEAGDSESDFEVDFALDTATVPHGRTTVDSSETNDGRSPSALSSSSSTSSASDGFTKDVEKGPGGHTAAAAHGGSASLALPTHQSLDLHGPCVVHMRGGDAAGSLVDDRAHDSPGTIAGGMAVGINAAAMGTAYLYEDGSRAAPYAALAMTVFGVMTVVFTSIQPLAGWVVSSVS